MQVSKRISRPTNPHFSDLLLSQSGQVGFRGVASFCMIARAMNVQLSIVGPWIVLQPIYMTVTLLCH